MFVNEYQKFLDNVKNIIFKALDVRLANGQIKEGPKNELSSLGGDVIDKLLSQGSIDAIGYASSRLPPGISEFLYRELLYFNALYVSNITGSQKELDDSETCKESLENILGSWLPDWVRNLFQILDEILRLASGG